MNTKLKRELKPLFLIGVCFTLSSGCATSVDEHTKVKQPIQTAQLWVDGDMRRVVAVTHIDSPAQDIVSVSRQDAPIGVSGVGQFLAMPGRHKLRWQPKAGETYEVEGRAYVGIRRDSPRFFDFALVVDSVDAVPAPILAQGQRLRSLNADSVFLSKSFTNAERIAWLCKIEELPNNQSRFVEW